MKKNILILMTLAFALFGMALPLQMALASSPTATGRAGITQVQVRAAAGVDTLKAAAKSANHPLQQAASAQAADACANDTPDSQEVAGGADTDNVDLQCGDQNGPEEQVESPSDSETGAADTDNVQDETPGMDVPQVPANVQSN